MNYNYFLITLFFKVSYKSTNFFISKFKEMAEWSKAHAWKVCIRQRIEGSNPSLSANNYLGC